MEQPCATPRFTREQLEHELAVVEELERRKAEAALAARRVEREWRCTLEREWVAATPRLSIALDRFSDTRSWPLTALPRHPPM